MAIGFTIVLLSVSVGFTGVLAGANLTIGVCTVPVVFDGARALAALMRCNTAVVRLIMASSAFTAVSGEALPCWRCSCSESP